MKKSIEKVFVVWGGNKPLADLLEKHLLQYDFCAIVGGGAPTDMYIGTQVFSQINQCTRAIILAEPKSDTNVFSSNLMFEWGYIVSKMDPRKIHVYIIDGSHKNLPSDLAGIWCNEIQQAGKSIDEVASEIVKKFKEAALRLVEIDKPKVLHDWDMIKKDIRNYASAPKYSEIELAHYVLHSIESSDYYMEEAEYDKMLSLLQPSSAALDFSIQIARASTEVFRATASMNKTLPFDIFLELKAVFARPFDFSLQDKNLHLWLTYVCNRRLGALYSAIAINDDVSESERIFYFERAIFHNSAAQDAIKQIEEDFPNDAIYCKLFEANVMRGKYRVYRKLKDRDKARACALASSQAREEFHLYYKNRFPNDTYLTRRMTEDYYLSLAAKLEYIDDKIEESVIRKTIKSYLLKVESENESKHARLGILKSIFSP